MRSILLAHARRYPQMEPRDAVKLLYQSEFGGGHLIRDEKACLDRLLEEYRATPQRRDAPLLEDIGSGIFRVNLAALDAWGYAPGALARDFIRSAAIHRGDPESFRAKLAMLTELTQEGKMPFSIEALNAYCTRYQAEGCPPVSHSDAYRNAYRPAYRVVDASCLPEELAKKPGFAYRNNS